MGKLKIVVPLVVGLALAGCTTGYQPQGFTGGYSDQSISPNIWQIRYAGNGYTTAETVQTFWLYHAAEFTLAHGFDGFRILAPSTRPAMGSTTELPVDLGLTGKPVLSLTIVLLKKPLTARPPTVFDAAALLTALQRLRFELCDGNVCPHIHSYLMPDMSR